MIREIADADLPAVRRLLVEGFPLRSEDYWKKGLANLGALPRVEGHPRYGYVVDADGALQGVLLAITADRGARGLCTHMSSWYVRDGYRHFALGLLRQVLDLRTATFINPSPSGNVLKILERLGFEPYTTGMVMLDLRTAVRGPHRRGSVRRLGIGDLADVPEAERRLAEDHIRMGCEVLRLETRERAGLLVHRRKWIRRAVPCSQVVFGDPELLLELAGPAMRAFATRGSALALCDAGRTTEHGPGRYFARGIRYFKGAEAPPVGDLSYSELAIFGP